VLLSHRSLFVAYNASNVTPRVVKGPYEEKFKMKEKIADIKKILVAFKKTIDLERVVIEDLIEKQEPDTKAKDTTLADKKVSCYFLSCRVQCIDSLSCFVKYQEELKAHKA
jgi:hypothetical protein